MWAEVALATRCAVVCAARKRWKLARAADGLVSEFLHCCGRLPVRLSSLRPRIRIRIQIHARLLRSLHAVHGGTTTLRTHHVEHIRDIEHEHLSQHRGTADERSEAAKVPLCAGANSQ